MPPVIKKFRSVGTVASFALERVSHVLSHDLILPLTSGNGDETLVEINVFPPQSGDHRNVYGTHFAHLFGFIGHPGEHIVFGVRPVITGRPTEADVALELARQVTDRLPGYTALTWDRAVRSRHVDALWDLRLQPVIGVHDKTGKHTDHFPLDEHTINGITVRLVAYKGAVCIPALSGSVTPLEPVRLDYQPNRRAGQRVYGLFQVPEGTDCDTRLWGHTVRQRLNSSDR
jgi:hypothetical protein